MFEGSLGLICIKLYLFCDDYTLFVYYEMNKNKYKKNEIIAHYSLHKE